MRESDFKRMSIGKRINAEKINQELYPRLCHKYILITKEKEILDIIKPHSIQILQCHILFMKKLSPGRMPWFTELECLHILLLDLIC